MASVDQGGHSFIRHDNYLLVPAVMYNHDDDEPATNALMDECNIKIIGSLSIFYRENTIIKNKIVRPFKERVVVGVMRFDPGVMSVEQATASDLIKVKQAMAQNKSDMTSDEAAELQSHFTVAKMLYNIANHGKQLQPSPALMQSKMLNPFKISDDMLNPSYAFRAQRFIPE